MTVRKDEHVIEVGSESVELMAPLECSREPLQVDEDRYYNAMLLLTRLIYPKMSFMASSALKVQLSTHILFCFLCCLPPLLSDNCPGSLARYVGETLITKRERLVSFP